MWDLACCVPVQMAGGVLVAGGESWHDCDGCKSGGPVRAVLLRIFWRESDIINDVIGFRSQQRGDSDSGVVAGAGRPAAWCAV